MYWSPMRTISGSDSNILKKGVVKKAPYTAKTAAVHRPSTIPWDAADSASAFLPSPRRREIREVTPTAVPTAKAICKFCIGKARDTAAMAFSLTWETK